MNIRRRRRRRRNKIRGRIINQKRMAIKTESNAKARRANNKEITNNKQRTIIRRRRK